MDVDFSSNDEQWNAGDDELEVLDDGMTEDVSKQLNVDEPSSHSANCPVCECDLSHLLALVSGVVAADGTSNPRFRREKTTLINASTPMSRPRVPHTTQVL